MGRKTDTRYISDGGLQYDNIFSETADEKTKNNLEFLKKKHFNLLIKVSELLNTGKSARQVQSMMSICIDVVELMIKNNIRFYENN